MSAYEAQVGDGKHGAKLGTGLDERVDFSAYTDFSCQTFHVTDGTSQTSKQGTRNVYCQAHGDVGVPPVVLDDYSTPRRNTTDRGAGPNHAVRRGHSHSDVQCQSDSKATARAHVYSQCDIVVYSPRRGEGQSNRLVRTSVQSRKSSGAQCNAMTSSIAQCQTAPLASAANHATSQTPPTDERGGLMSGLGPLAVWATTDTQSQTGRGATDFTSQTEKRHRDVTMQTEKRHCEILQTEKLASDPEQKTPAILKTPREQSSGTVTQFPTVELPRKDWARRTV